MTGSIEAERIGGTIDLVPGRPRRVARDQDAAGGRSRGRTRGGDPNDVPPTLVASSSVGDGVDAVRFLLCGHLDTVHDPHGSFQAMTALEGDRATGPGVMDMKGGLVVAIHALERFIGRAVLDWSTVLVSDEETGTFFGEEALVEAARDHDVGLVFEPALADGSLVVERMDRGPHAGGDRSGGPCRAGVQGRAFGGRGVVACDRRGVRAGGSGRGPDRERRSGARLASPMPSAPCPLLGQREYEDAETQAALEADIHRVVEASIEGSLEIDDPPKVRVRTAFLRPAKPGTKEVVESEAGEGGERGARSSDAFASTGGAATATSCRPPGSPRSTPLVSGAAGCTVPTSSSSSRASSSGRGSSPCSCIASIVTVGNRKGSGRSIP